MRKKLKGRYTIEAALIMPIVLGLMTIAMRAAIVCYEEVKETAQGIGANEEKSAVKVLYEIETVEEIFGWIK